MTGKLTRPCKVVNYHLGTYTTDDFIADLYARTPPFSQLSNMTAKNYAEAL